MINPAIELQGKVYSRLSTHAPLLAELGAKRIYDAAPHGTKPPYVLFAKTFVRDWSTDTEQGAIILMTIETWSARHGRKQVLTIDEILKDAVADMEGPMDEHQLVSFSWVQSETDNVVRENRFRCRTTFEAMIEPIMDPLMDQMD